MLFTVMSIWTSFIQEADDNGHYECGGNGEQPETVTERHEEGPGVVLPLAGLA